MAIIARQDNRFGDLAPIFLQHSRPLAVALRDLLQEQRSYLLESIKLGEAAPAESMTLAHWGQPAQFTALSQRYSDYLYRDHPDHVQESKPVQSLWAQWYFGLLVPPMMMALLLEPRALDCSPEHIRVQFHDNGHPAVFWFDVQEDQAARYLSPVQRIDRLIHQHLIPAVAGITRHGGINAKLIWNNMGFSFWWFLGELKNQLDPDLCSQLEQQLFHTPQLLDGSDNPLYRTMILRHGQMERRSCCQRYRIPDVAQCGNCTLAANS